MLSPGSEAADAFQRALGVGVGGEQAEAVVKGLEALNGVLGVHHERDVRLVCFRPSTRGSKLAVRFTLVQRGGTTRGANHTARVELPAIGGQLNLDQMLSPTGSNDDSVRSSLSASDCVLNSPSDQTSDGIHRTEFSTQSNHIKQHHESTWHSAENTDEVVEETPAMVLPDGTPLPNLSGLLTNQEIADLWNAGRLNDLNDLDALFADFADVPQEAISDEDEMDVSSLMERFRAQAELASAPPSIDTSELHERGSWNDISRNVVAWTKEMVRTLREARAKQHLVVLAPSPGTGKSRGMMEAAAQEQIARRRVGYAVLSRTQISEASERLRANDATVRLIVVEGRHEGNCEAMDHVHVATSAGFSPGSTVCPDCHRYPHFGGGNKNVCPYYKARIDASRDRFFAKMGMVMPAIILTTHASAVQGSHIATKRFQSFWDFDTLFIDEDPTSAMIQQHELTAESLTYLQRDANGLLNGPSLGTAVLREAMQIALRQRQEAEEHGFIDPVTGAPDRIHSRSYGSSYAGGDLHALLDPISRRHGLTPKGLSSVVLDTATIGPVKGEIMNLSPIQVADRFPHRFLAPTFAAIDMEITSIAEARAVGVDLEPAYRVHLDLVADDDDPEQRRHHAALRVHELRGYAGTANILIGDAYADVAHYEGLFGRFRRDGKVHSIRHRAAWPTTSTLVRVVTRAGTKQISNDVQLLDHLEKNVRPVLELERGRRIVFYVHLAMKDDLTAWLRQNQQELEISEFAIEHWGSGRGKDIYKDFDTFVAVTEYVPNIGALMHEANTVAAIASPGNTRIAHWSPIAPRQGSSTFAQSLGNASPYFQAAFHRKATDELAQAVHRIRPAIPSDRHKRAYVFGHMVPWTDELLAATAATAVVDSGKDEVDLETEALGHGTRFSMTETLSLISAREVAGAINEVFTLLGCWSHAFAHALLSVPSWNSIEDLVIGKRTNLAQDKTGLVNYISLRGDPSGLGLVSRVLRPPSAWSTIAGHLQQVSATYRAGLQLLASLQQFPSRRLRASWMRGSPGYEFWGDQDRFARILNMDYAPNAERVPF